MDEAARKANRQRAYDDFIGRSRGPALAQGASSRISASRAARTVGCSWASCSRTARPVQSRRLPGSAAGYAPVQQICWRARRSWMDEYAQPGQTRRLAYISNIFALQNMAKGRNYPRVLFMTSTRDDRVHPGHARKMVAGMKEQGHEVLYFENIEGGHGGAANNKQAAYMSALAYTFLRQRTGPPLTSRPPGVVPQHGSREARFNWVQSCHLPSSAPHPFPRKTWPMQLKRLRQSKLQACGPRRGATCSRSCSVTEESFSENRRSRVARLVFHAASEFGA